MDDVKDYFLFFFINFIKVILYRKFLLHVSDWQFKNLKFPDFRGRRLRHGRNKKQVLVA